MYVRERETYVELSRKTVRTVSRVVENMLRERGKLSWKDTFYRPWIEVSMATSIQCWARIAPLVRQWAVSRALFRGEIRETTRVTPEIVFSAPPGLGMYSPSIIVPCAMTPGESVEEDVLHNVNLSNVRSVRMEIGFPWEYGNYSLVVYVDRSICICFPLADPALLHDHDLGNRFDRPSYRKKFKKKFACLFASNAFSHGLTLKIFRP